MRCRPSLTLAILSASGLMLAGCATSPGKLAVDLKALKECQRLDAGRSSVPPITEETDYRELAADALADAGKARRVLAARTDCENRVIEKFAKAR